MGSIANAVIILWGWRRFAVAVLAGAVSAFAFAPFNLFPLLFVTIPVLVWLLDGATAREGAGMVRRFLPAAFVGWSFGLGFFVAGLWWVGAALLVEAGEFAWALPLAVLALPAGLALFWGLGAVLARIFWTDGWPRILLLASAFSLAEYLRGHLLTGFPWNAFGYALAPTPLMMQSAALVGLWGLTLAAFFIFAAPALLADAGRHGGRGRAILLALAAVLFLAHLGYGAIVLARATGETVPGIAIRIVQPAIPQSDKMSEAAADSIFRRHLELSDAASPSRQGLAGVTLLIWPESAFPFILTERPDALSAIGELLPAGTTLITGAARVDQRGTTGPSVFNSIYAIDDEGGILSAYDKVHLVPFGEFLPFQAALESIGIRQVTGLPGGFATGPGLRTLAVAGVPSFAPLICYEIIFPSAVIAEGDRPRWFLNVTNDAWYGNTPGPRQHFLQARVRAVEEGLPLVRAANSGISAIVDANGRIVESLGVGVAGIVDGPLPVNRPPTPYGRFGDLIFVAVLGVAFLAGVLGKIYL